jgi:hypothetical protein
MFQRITVEEIIAQARLLSLEDEARIVAELSVDLQQRLETSSKPRYNVQDFRGIAHGIWDDVGGVDEFIKQERASWD